MNSYKKMTAVLYFCLLFSFFSCQQEKFKKLTLKEISISYPSYLELSKDNREGVVFALMTKKKNDKDVFIENVNLVSENVNNTDFTIYVESVKEQISKLADIVESKIFKNNDQIYYRIIFSLTQNNIDLKVIQHYYLYKNKIYVLTFTSQLKEFNDYVKDINNSFLSFKIIED